jgi:hypothetical protein
MKKSKPKTERAEPVLKTAAKAIGSTIGKLAAQTGLASETAGGAQQTSTTDIQQQYYENAQQQLAEARALKQKWNSAPPAVQNHLDEIIAVYEGIVDRYEAGQFGTQLSGDTPAREE